MALQCLRFSNPASTFITDQQGLNSLEEFHPLTNEEVESLVKVTRCPGGTIPNPAAGPLLPQTPNLGIPISLQAETALSSCVTCCSTWSTPCAPLPQQVSLSQAYVHSTTIATGSETIMTLILLS